jgi:hypothetical protein
VGGQAGRDPKVPGWEGSVKRSLLSISLSRPEGVWKRVKLAVQDSFKKKGNCLAKCSYSSQTRHLFTTQKGSEFQTATYKLVLLTATSLVGNKLFYAIKYEEKHIYDLDCILGIINYFVFFL